MVTIKEVAKRAGVSPTTASYALNNRPEVKPSTRERVCAAAKELNYVPNKLAQSIRNGKSNTITVMTSENIECGNTFSAEFLGILAGARVLNYDVLVKLVDLNLTDDEEIERLLGTFSDGYLLLGNHLDNVAQILVRRNRKCVMLSSHSDVPIVQVNSDGRKWTENLTEYVLKSGRKKPAYFCYELLTIEEKLRCEGYLAAMKNGGAPEVFTCGVGAAELDDRLKAALAAGHDAIICWNDVLAIQVIEALTAMGHRVPEDVAVTGFDDNLSYPNSLYQLTTVRQEFQTKGRVAIQELIAQIDGEGTSARDVFVDCSIVARNTL